MRVEPAQSVYPTRLKLIAAVFLFCAVGFAQVKPIELALDITDAPRKIFHAKLVIPVKPGPLTLMYPEWIPGGALRGSATAFICSSFT